MRIRDHIKKELIFTQLQVQDKWELLKLFVERLVEVVPEINPDDLLTQLKQREAEETTGIGQGVAIPHARVAGLHETICALAQIPDGVDFKAVDGQHVTCVFLLISAVDAVGTHIKLLARIARLAQNMTFINAIVGLKNADDVYQKLIEEDARHVA